MNISLSGNLSGRIVDTGYTDYYGSKFPVGGRLEIGNQYPVSAKHALVIICTYYIQSFWSMLRLFIILHF